MEFERDLLISYAHIDDQSLIEGERGWISEFHRSLEIRLAQLMGSKPKIWRDAKLQGNDFFGDEISDQLPNVAILVSILSPRYVNSRWCLREVSEFMTGAADNIGARVKNKSRVFKVIKTPVPRDQHPGVTRDLLGYDFFSIDHETGRTLEFSKMYGQDAERAYWAKLNDLAHDISELLTDIKSLDAKPVEAEVVESAPTEDKPTAFLAQVSYDLREERDSIRRELEEAGFRVLPKSHLPMIAPDLEAELEQILDECAVSFHLVGSNYGIVPEGTHKSLVEVQNAVAARKAADGTLKRVIWLSPEREVEDDRQITFIEDLREDPAQLEGADLFESDLEDVKFAIHDFNKAAEAEAPTPTAESPEDQGPATVYLICDQQDMDEVLDLEDSLFDAGFEVILPVFEGEEADIRTDHQENLKNCDATLLYYGHGNELWLRSKTRELLKIAGYGRTRPLLAKAVLIGGPENPRKARFRSHDSLVINAMGGFSAELLTPFVEQLSKAR